VTTLTVSHSSGVLSVPKDVIRSDPVSRACSLTSSMFLRYAAARWQFSRLPALSDAMKNDNKHTRQGLIVPPSCSSPRLSLFTFCKINAGDLP
jgi:hypothetical protein